MSEEAFDDVTSLQTRLAELRAEHRDLDDAIARLTGAPQDDELLLRRLKKRKLILKDQIQKLRTRLIPDIIA